MNFFLGGSWVNTYSLFGIQYTYLVKFPAVRKTSETPILIFCKIKPFII